MATNKELRQERILKMLDQPQTIKELSKALSASYYTIRNDIQELIEHGVIAPVGDVREGATLYGQGSTRPMPEFRTSGTDFVRMDSLALAFLENPDRSSGSEAILKLSRIMAELLFIACSAADTGQPPTVKTLNDLHQAALSADTRIQMLASVSRALLHNKTIWDAAHIGEIVADPTFDAQTFLLSYESFLRREADDAQR